MMNKNGLKGLMALGILFVLVSVIAFAVPTDKTGTFWIAYAFTTIAFAAQIGIGKMAFGQEKPLKSKYLGFPLVQIGFGYLIIQLLAFAVFLFAPMLPAWSAIIACTMIAGIAAVSLIGADVSEQEIGRIEAGVQKKVFYIQALQVDVEMLAEAETDVGTKEALVKLAEKIRFSDPMSHEMLEDLESRISAKVAEIATTTDKAALICEIVLLIDERNRKCKILK